MPKKPRMQDGDFWSFPVLNGIGIIRVRAAQSATCSVYGRIFTDATPSLEEVAKTEIAFTIRAQVDTPSDKFTKLGNLPLEPSLHEVTWFWRRIVANESEVTLVPSRGDSVVVPVDRADGLERAGGYPSESVAKRLVAWLAGNDETMANNTRSLRNRDWM